MLTREDNELFTRTGAGTPVGELFRCFWIPARLPSELPHPDSDPVGKFDAESYCVDMPERARGV
jgi:hypothetical protein